MAADTMAVIENPSARTAVKFLTERKIMQRRGYLLAVGGDVCPPNAEFLEWFFSGIGERKRPKLTTLSFEALVVTPAGKIEVWDHRGNCEPITGPFFAIGSGQEFALGAMEAGATAPRAVAIAIKRCPTCSGRVTVRKWRKS